MDEQSFNAGFDAAVRGLNVRGVRFDHPNYLRDRRMAFQRAGGAPPLVGPTGAFPRGAAGPHDEGELAVALAADHGEGIVRLHFGTRVEWLGLAAIDARALAAKLLEKADELDARKA